MIWCLAADGSATSVVTNHASPRTFAGQADGEIQDYSLGTPVTTAWGSDSEGRYIDLNNGGTATRVRLHGNVAQFTQAAGTLAIRFKFVAGIDTLTRFIVASSDNSTTTVGTLRVVKVASAPTTVRVVIENGASDMQYEWTAADVSQMCTLILRWGPRGCRAWINGVLGTATNGIDTYTGGIVTRASEYWWLGRGTNAGLCQVYQFGLWDIELEDRELDELWADPYAPTRPKPAGWRTVIPLCGRAKTSSAQFRLVASDGLTGTIHARIKTAATVAGLDAGTVHGPASTSTPNAAVTITATGLSGTLFWLCEWSTDGATWYPMPGGYGRVTTQKAAGSAYSIVTISDDHVCAQADGGILPATLGNGIDILLDDSYPPVANSDGKRKAWLNWRAAHAIYRDESPDFILLGGDNFYQETDATNTTADINTGMFDACERWINRWWLAAKLGAVFAVAGNHECMAGYQIFRQARQRASRKQATIAWKRFMPNPGPSDYPEGGETGSGPDQLPATAYASPPAWTLFTPYSVGQVVRKTVDNYFAYECTVPGTSAGGEPIWPTTIGGTVTDGTVTWTCRYRWDAGIKAIFEDDAGGENASPYYNYFGFSWGDLRIVVADVTRYSGLGEDNATYRQSLAAYQLGATQKAWISAALNMAGPRWKVLAIHNLPGGEAIAAGGTGASIYGRSSGLWVNKPDYWAAQGLTENPEEIWLLQQCKAAGAVIVKGHDHRYAELTNDGVRIVSLPTSGAPNHFDEIQTYPGWNFTEMERSYGTSQSQGALDHLSADHAARGMVKMLNVLGYVRIDVHPTTGLRFTLVRTGFPTRGTAGSGVYTNHHLDSDRFIAQQTESKDGSHRIDLADTLNAAPRPSDVGLCVDESALTGTWWTAALTQRYAPAGHTTWAAASYTLGQVVVPTTPNGRQYRCATAGASGAGEPTWQTNVGDVTNDGAVQWTCEPIGALPYAEDEPLPNGTVQLSAAAAATVRAEAVPLTVYQSGWIAQGPATPPELPAARKGVVRSRTSVGRLFGRRRRRP